MSKYSNMNGRACEGQTLVELLKHPMLINPKLIESSETKRAIDLYTEMNKNGFKNIYIEESLNNILKIEHFKENPIIKLLPDVSGSKGFSEDISIEDGVKSIALSVKNKRLDTKSLRVGKKEFIDKYVKTISTIEEQNQYSEIRKLIKLNNGLLWGDSNNPIKKIIFEKILIYLQAKISRLTISELQQLTLGFLGRNDYYLIGLEKIYVYNPNGSLNYKRGGTIQNLVSVDRKWDTLKILFNNNFGIYIRLHNDTPMIGKTNPKAEIGWFSVSA